MSSRQEQKERLRREREQAEQAAAASSGRRKRLGIILGAVLAAAVALIVILAVASGDDGGSDQAGGDANIPPFEVTNVNEAARAAGCRIEESPATGGSQHTTETVQYRTNPPTSGAHDPAAAQDGVYEAGNPPDVEQSVHSLEHGRINIQYKKGSPPAMADRLEALVNQFEVKGTAGYHGLLFENQTAMEPVVAAAAWGKMLSCPAMNDKVFDALRSFWRTNVDKGPEFVP